MNIRKWKDSPALKGTRDMLEIKLEDKKVRGMSAVAHACKPSTLGGRGGRPGATVVAMFRKNMAAVARQGAKSAVMFRSYGSNGKPSASGCG